MERFVDILTTILAFVFGFVPLFGHEAYYKAHIVPHQPEAHVLFGGDLMFDRSIRTTIDEKGGDYIFSCIDSVLKNADVVVANLEGPITASSSVSVGSAVGGPNNFTFTFPLSTAGLLKSHNISIVNLGNNHIMNFGNEGLMQTKAALERAGVRYFGDPDASEADKVLRERINGIDFSFVNWSDWTSDKTDHTVAQVREEAGAGRVVVVYTHWGEEYIEPLPRVRELAHQFVDAGASIVIGSHPHVVQDKESYKGKDIYYSLGNFVFDQYWNDAVSHGLLIDVAFTTSGAERVREIPIVLQRDRRTCLVE